VKPGEDANGDHKVEMGGRKRQGVNVRMLHSHTISDAGLGDPLGSGAHHRLACAHGIDEEATFREPHGQVAGAASDLQRARATLERARGDEGQDDILAALVDEALQVGTPIDSVPIRRRRVEVLFYVPLKITSCADASRRVLDALPLDPSMGSHLASRRRQPAHRVICALSDKFAANRKRVNRYALPTASGVTKLSIYLAPTSTSGSQVLKVIIYADNGGAPGALLGVSERLTFTSASSAGWYDLVFPSPVKLAAGNYWIGVITGASNGVAGFRYDSVTGSRDFNINQYSSGPSDPFGSSFTTDNEQTSLYATYTGDLGNTKPPAITGTPQQGQTLTEVHGTWTSEPTGYAYQWQRCDSSGSNCMSISGATGQTYALAAADVGQTIRVQETASNASGSGTASSSATAVVTPLPPVSTAPPTISGTAQQGQTLTAVNGAWTNEPTGYAHQWLQCDSSGSSCTPIAGATAQTYVLVGGDVSHTIRVQETASNEGGSSAPATSAQTAAGHATERRQSRTPLQLAGVPRDRLEQRRAGGDLDAQRPRVRDQMRA
jgi:hypothetical protein